MSLLAFGSGNKFCVFRDFVPLRCIHPGFPRIHTSLTLTIASLIKIRRQVPTVQELLSKAIVHAGDVPAERFNPVDAFAQLSDERFFFFGNTLLLFRVDGIVLQFTELLRVNGKNRAAGLCNAEAQVAVLTVEESFQVIRL